MLTPTYLHIIFALILIAAAKEKHIKKVLCILQWSWVKFLSFNFDIFLQRLNSVKKKSRSSQTFLNIRKCHDGDLQSKFLVHNLCVYLYHLKEESGWQKKPKKKNLLSSLKHDNIKCIFEFLKNLRFTFKSRLCLNWGKEEDIFDTEALLLQILW